jgi:hypothetical protein
MSLRVIQEKRYRSMQEHIRRAHPRYYIPKLPANEESFLTMINTVPSEKPHEPADSMIETKSLFDHYNVELVC